MVGDASYRCFQKRFSGILTNPVKQNRNNAHDNTNRKLTWFWRNLETDTLIGWDCKTKHEGVMSRKRCPLAVLSLTAGSRATKAHSIGHMMYWQKSVTNMSVSDQGGGERNGSKTCVPRLWLITTYALTSHWQSDTVPSRVKTAPKMLVIFDVNVIIYLCDSFSEATWTCQSCTYSVDFKEINTISQSLPSTCAICLQPRQSGRHRVDMMTSSNGNIFRVTGPLCGEFTGPRWIPHTKASDAELWCLLWSAPE